jgi:hypothetical protein
MLLNVCPTESTYAAKRNTSGYLRVELDGGMGRYRKDILDPATTVNCRWAVRKEYFDYLWAFYRTYLRTMESFHVDLILEECGKVRVLANIIPDSFQFDTKQGSTYTITAQLEVLSPLYDAQTDADYIEIINVFGPDYEKWIDRLWRIVNIDFQAAMPVPPLYS